MTISLLDFSKHLRPCHGSGGRLLPLSTSPPFSVTILVKNVFSVQLMSVIERVVTFHYFADHRISKVKFSASSFSILQCTRTVKLEGTSRFQRAPLRISC